MSDDVGGPLFAANNSLFAVPDANESISPGYPVTNVMKRAS